MGKKATTELKSLDALKTKSVDGILKKFLSACSSNLLTNLPLSIPVIPYLARL